MSYFVRWTDDDVTAIRALAEQGYSAAQAALHFNGMTRNMVVGLAHRKGIQFHGKSGGKNQHGFSKIPKDLAYIEPRSTDDEVTVPFVPRQPHGCVTLMELNDSTCRWPIGDPRREDFVYCGEPPAEGRPYCQGHCGLAYIPKNDRRLP